MNPTYRFKNWAVTLVESNYKENKWEAVHDNYDGPEHRGFVYAATWPKVRDEILEIEAEYQL